MSNLSKAIKNVIDKSATKATFNRADDTKGHEYRAVQNGLKSLEHLSTNGLYHHDFICMVNEFHLDFAENIKSDLRDIINMELGSDNEECITANADDLVFLDKHKYIRFVDFNDVEDLPNLKTLRKFGKRLDQITRYIKPQTLSHCRTTDDLPF